MTASLATDRGQYESFRRHLASAPEQVGFFLADYEATARTLTLRGWRPIPHDAFEVQNDFHLTLHDEVRAEVIKWAWDNGAALVEAHSHAAGMPASFSASDMWGIDECVLHM